MITDDFVAEVKLNSKLHNVAQWTRIDAVASKCFPDVKGRVAATSADQMPKLQNKINDWKAPSAGPAANAVAGKIKVEDP